MRTLFFTLSLLVTSSALAGSGISLTGDILSIDEKTMVFIADNQRWEIDRSRFSVENPNNNCDRVFSFATEEIKKVRPLKSNLSVICTNREKKS